MKAEHIPAEVNIHLRAKAYELSRRLDNETRVIPHARESLS